MLYYRKILKVKNGVENNNENNAKVDSQIAYLNDENKINQIAREMKVWLTNLWFIVFENGWIWSKESEID